MKLYKSPVVFDAASHTYHLDGVELRGVTSTLIKRAFPDKYKGIDEEVLANAAKKGHELHEAIQNYDRFGVAVDDRVELYQLIKDNNKLSTIENEYLVSDEENYASSIDIVMENEMGVVCLADIKTTWNLDKASVALQLSIYKRFFEMQNDGITVGHLYAIWLPNKDHSQFELVEVQPVSDDVLDGLIEADLKGEPYNYVPVPEGYDELEILYRHYSEIKKDAEVWIDRIKGELLVLMKEKKLTQIKSPRYTVSYIAERTDKKFNSALLKKERKDLYDLYSEDRVTGEQIRFTEVKTKNG